MSKIPQRSDAVDARGTTAVRAVAFAALALLAATAVGGPSLAAAQEVRHGQEHFDWGDADHEVVTYEWSVELENTGDEPVQLEVVFQMLDDDDQVVHRDSVAVTLRAGQTRVVRKSDGSLQYDRAADVVSYRFRFNSSRP